MKSFALALVMAVLTCANAANATAAKKPLIPEREWAMIRQLQANYDLTTEQTWLLAAIRRHENGRPGLEFGIGGPMKSGHPSHRYRDGFKSFYVQGAWAAGTIKNNYKGDIVAFGKRYCPGAPIHWANSVAKLMAMLKRENNNRLPGEKQPKRNISFP